MKIKVKSSAFTAFLVLVFGCLSTMISQEGFLLEKPFKKYKISFELVNNLVIVPVNLNGEDLSFLLDTGVSTSILFGITQADSIRVNSVKPIKIRGLGGGEGVDAFESNNNIIRIGKAVDTNHKLYVIFDKSLNFSPRMGIPIHGIIGFDFFRNFSIKFDYVSKRLTIFDPQKASPRIGKAFQEFDLSFDKGKPYVNLNVDLNEKNQSVKLLVDSGSSDALWLFDEAHSITESPKNYFNDFLGLGLSGHIYGKRSKLNEISMGDFKLSNVNVAFPNEEALQNILFFEGRDGSLGGDLLKRFTVIFDYPSMKMYLRKNSFFNHPFYYNMSGLTIEHSGMTLVKDIDNSSVDFRDSERFNESQSKVTIQVSPVFKFFLAPRFVVADVRENSPAAIAGIEEGDEILSINGRSSFRYELFEITSLFTSKEGKRINMEIDRNGRVFKVKFILKEVI